MTAWTCDPVRFEQICAAVVSENRRDGGIGTLGEKSIHAVLKYYFDENPDTHEQSVGDSVADIVGADGVIEIQTRMFQRLNRKLDALLPVCPVTVVYPVVRRKRLIWIDPQTGEALHVGSYRQFQKDVAVLLESCDDYEIRVVKDTVTALLDSLRRGNNLKKQTYTK